MDFENLYKIQKLFTEKFFTEKHNIDLKEVVNCDLLRDKWNKEYVTCIIRESSELFDFVNWKLLEDENFIDRNKKNELLENIIDVIKYSLGLAVINGFNYEDVEKKFVEKSDVVEIKLKQDLKLNEIKNKRDKPLIIIDIDGVLSDYPKTFLQTSQFNTIPDFKRHDISLYNKFKEEYRTSGIKRNLDVRDGSYEFIKFFKEKSYIVLFTSRPYCLYYNIYGDTIEWLKNKEIYYDFIIWNNNKYKYILDNLSDNEILFCVDDSIDNCNYYSSNNFVTYLITNEQLYCSKEDMNRSIKTTLNEKVKVVDSLQEIMKNFER